MFNQEIPIHISQSLINIVPVSHDYLDFNNISSHYPPQQCAIIYFFNSVFALYLFLAFILKQQFQTIIDKLLVLTYNI